MDTLIIAKGELWLHRDGQRGVQITSAFAREVVERDERARRNTSWKHAPREREQQTGVIPAGALWGTQQAAPLAPPKFLHATFGPDGETLYYVLRVGEATGLFRQHLQDQREVRLFHKNGIRVHGLTYNAAERRLVLAMQAADGTAQLEVYDEEGTLKGAVTGGDSVDASPAMLPGSTSTVLFQTAGVARHPERGFVAAVGHAALARLDYKSGQLDTVLEDRAYDFVAPRAAPDGTIYAIRRPIEKPVHERAGTALLDVVLMPFRLAKAIFGYLNFFSTIYGKEPLRSAGGPRTPELDQDLGRLWLHGRMIELKRANNDPQYAGNLVPRSWELVRLPPSKRADQLQIVAWHVAAYDIAGDGTIVYTNGYDVLSWRDGAKLGVGRYELVEGVAAR